MGSAGCDGHAPHCVRAPTECRQVTGRTADSGHFPEPGAGQPSWAFVCDEAAAGNSCPPIFSFWALGSHLTNRALCIPQWDAVPSLWHWGPLDALASKGSEEALRAADTARGCGPSSVPAPAVLGIKPHVCGHLQLVLASER